MMFLQIPNVDTDKLVEADSTAKAKVAQQIENFSHMSWEDAAKTIAGWALEFVLKLALALAIWYVGRWMIRKLQKVVAKIFERRKLDQSLCTFLQSLISITLTLILIMLVIDVLGLNATSFLALFAAAGLAVGMALSGTMQNFAGGVMVLLLKPYRVGDYIEAQGQAGTVKSIQLFNTVITTPDNKTILIPNGPISTGIVNNYSQQPTRRVEWIVGINYGDDFELARKVIKELLDADQRIIRDRGYTIEINELAASSVNIVIRVWVNAADFWDVFFEMNKKMYKTFPEKGIEFPFAQLDVHISK